VSVYRCFDSTEICYQNVRDLCTTYINFLDVCVIAPKIICIIETWLNDLFCNCHLFPDNYFVFHADKNYTDSNLTSGGGVLTAVHNSFSSCKHMYDLET
jgi:hypothetical protein